MKIIKTKCNYQVVECDLKFGEDIVLDGEKLIPISVLDKIKEEVDKLTVYHTTKQGSELLSKNAVIRLINKHLGESENKK